MPSKSVLPWGSFAWARVGTDGECLKAGRTYRFSVLAGSLTDPELSLRQASGAVLASANDTTGSRQPQIDFRCSSSGRYFLDVGSANNLGVGSYSVQALDLLPADDYTANATRAGALAIGGSTTAAVDGNGDRDWFRVALVAANTYQFTLSGITLADPNLVLRDANGSELAFNDDASGLNAQIRFTATTTGDHYLDAGAYAFTDTGTYTIQAALVGQALDDFAADTGTTGSLSLGRVSDGVVNFVGDRDWFRVSLTAGRSYQFHLDGRTLSDPSLRLLDGSGGTVLAANDNNGSSRDSLISYAPSTSGTYYLDAGAAGSQLGGYSLSAADVTPDATDRITGLQVPAIRAVVNADLSDNSFSNTELASLLRQAGDGGVSAQELGDLRLIGANLSPYLSATSRVYSQYLYNAVVNGNPANQWWTGGGSSRVLLGNLADGSSAQQLNRLVDKWFGGLDLPSNSVGGDAAAGLSGLSFSYAPMSGPLFVDDVNFDDINQGQAGTCYLLASLATLATSNRRAIHDMFVDNNDGTYGVRFYGSSGNELWVTVNRSVPVIRGAMALATNSLRSLTGEMWVALAEKAYAQANEIGQFARATAVNGYQAIEGGLEDVLSHLTNRATTGYSSFYTNTGWTSASNNLSVWNSYRDLVIAALNSGRSLWLGSFGDSESGGKQTFVNGHAFAIIGFNQDSGNFVIANPWGRGGTYYAPVFEASWATIFAVKGVVAWV